MAVARALVHEPLLVLADEPTGNLDLDTGRQVLDLLDRLTRRAGRTMVMATHSPEVVGLADRIFRLQDGRLVETREPGGRMILLRASVRHLVRHPWQAALSVLGIALGVAVVVSVDLSSASARRAFALSAEGVTGRATHQVVGGPAGVDERVVARLTREAGAHPVAPAIEAWVGVEGAPGRTLQLLGIDPFSEAPFRPYLRAGGADARGAGAGARALGTLVTEPGAVLLSRETAADLGVGVSGTLVLRVSGRSRPVRVAGLIEPMDSRSEQALRGLVVADLTTAQEVLGQQGRLSRVDLIVPEGPRGEEALARIRATLMPGMEVVPAAARSEFVGELTRAFDVNLTALSLLALDGGALPRLQHDDVLRGPAPRDASGCCGPSASRARRSSPPSSPRRSCSGWPRRFSASALGRGAWPAGWCDSSPGPSTTSTSSWSCGISRCRRPSWPRAPPSGSGPRCWRRSFPRREASAAPPGAAIRRIVLEARARRAAPRAALAGLGAPERRGRSSWRPPTGASAGATRGSSR